MTRRFNRAYTLGPVRVYILRSHLGWRASISIRTERFKSLTVVRSYRT